MTIRPVRWIVVWSCLIAAALLGAPAAAQNHNPIEIIEQQGERRQINFVEADLNSGPGYVAPQSGWIRRTFAGVNFEQDADEIARGDKFVMWYRVRFDAADAGAGPLAFETDHTAERIVLYLNGVDIFRTFASEDDNSFGWNRPRMANLPNALVRPGINELIVRVDAANRRNLRLGAIRVGAYDMVQNDYNWRMWTRIHGVQIINGVLFILTGATILFWLVRRQETVFAWLGAVGVVWIFRNFHYYLEEPPFDINLFWNLSVQALFVLMVVIYGFVAAFIQLPYRNRFMAWLTGAGLVIMLLAINDVPQVGGTSISLLATLPVSMLVFWVFFRHCIKHPGADSLIMFMAITTAFSLSVHDLGLLARWWNGTEFYLQPYGSVIVYSAFGFALGRRILLALSAEEMMNVQLEQRVREATSALQVSEAERRRLEVDGAVEQERLRLMREIHDGIGSNLVTALAVARNKKGADAAVSVLRRSITDLKIAVDSLEPAEGDVSLILAGFRQRIQSDLAEAGIALKWHVDAVPQLSWLEATNTLHVLRIFQEVFANIIAHSGANEIQVLCHAHMMDGKEGVIAEFIDNGRGLREEPSVSSKGIINMIARAQSLGGVMVVENTAGATGTRAALWLPAERRITRVVGQIPLAAVYELKDAETASLYRKALADISTRESVKLNAAMSALREVIRREPTFAPGYATLVETWLMAADHGDLTDEESYGEAHRTAKLALEIDPELPGVHRILGLMNYWWERNAAQAGEHFRQAIMLDPQDGYSHFVYASALADNGEYTAAQREYAAATPHLEDTPLLAAHLGLLRWSKGDRAGGLAEMRALVRENPGFALGWTFLGLAQLTQGDLAAYLDCLQHTSRIRRQKELQVESEAFQQAMRDGEISTVWLTIARHTLATESNRIRPNTAVATLCACHARDIKLTRSILSNAIKNREKWGNPPVRAAIAKAWRDKSDIAQYLAALTSDQMEPELLNEVA